MVQPRFLAIFILTTTTRFPTRQITAIHLCEQKHTRLHISIKSEKITPIKQKHFFLKLRILNESVFVP